MTVGLPISACGAELNRAIMQSDDHSAVGRESADRISPLQRSLSRRIHQLNNLLTAFHCLGDEMADGASRPSGKSASSGDFVVVTEQLREELRGILNDAASLLSQIESQVRGTTATVQSDDAIHSECRSAGTDRASNRGPNSSDTQRKSI